jgi:hypothetical protein
MQRERRHDPYPWTWEPAALAGALLLIGLVLGVQVGRSLANLAVGAGWMWPESRAGDGPGPGPSISSPIGGAFWRSLSGVLSGDAGDGLAKPVPDPLAGPGLVWGSVAATEIVILTALIWMGAWTYLRWGPGRLRGMATRSEADAILGVTRIRKVADIVRPDLYGRHRHPRTSHQSAPHAGMSIHRRAAKQGRTPADQTHTQPVVDQHGGRRHELPPNLENDVRIGGGLSSAFLPRRRSRQERGTQQR